MDHINHKGSPTAPVWIIVNRFYDTDKAKGYVFSGGLGIFWDIMMKDAGIPNYYVYCRFNDLTNKFSTGIVQNDLNHYKPPIIITLEEAGKCLCKELDKKYTKGTKTPAEYVCDIEKQAGSLLKSPDLNYDHWIIPTLDPVTIQGDYSLRDIVINLDLGKAREELIYFKQHGHTQPLKLRELEYDFTEFDLLRCLLLGRFSHCSLISNDIETVYPKVKSAFYRRHPGLPVTIGLADSDSYGISFELFRKSPVETKELWRILDSIFRKVPQLGQNFFNFDMYYYEMLGFEFGYTPKDTLIRHNILWPELPHKLQFMTRQYTRQPYYKDEGHGWSIKNMDKLKNYNCLDVCVTMEVYNEQEKEFDERPYLR